MRKKVCVVLVLMFLLVFPQAGYAVDDEKDDIKVSVVAGFNGVYKYGYYTPISVEVQNNREDIDGELQIETAAYGNYLTAYSTTVNIPKGSTKNFIISIPIIRSGNINIKILDGKNQIYKESMYPPTGLSQETYLIGILSDDYDSINYFRNSKRTTGSIKLDEKNFPEKFETMKMFNAVIVNNFDTSKLNMNQYDNLKKWVSSGGLLIVGTGPSYTKTLSLFRDSFIPGKTGELKYINTKSLYAFIGSKIENTMKINVLNMDIEESRPLIQDGGDALIHLIERGEGTILVSEFDLGLEPVSGWDGNLSFGTGIIEGFPQNIDNAKYMMNIYGMLDNALRIIPDMPKPEPTVFIIMFIIYMLIVGPVNYLILKRKDKRELMWITVPALSFIFAGIIYISGFGTRLNRPIANVISIVEASKKGAVRIDSYAGIYVPVKSNIRVEAEGQDVWPVMNPDMYYYGIQSPVNNSIKTIDSKVSVSPRPYVEFYKNSVWSMRTVAMANAYPEGGTLECVLNYSNYSFSGTIKNNTGMDLEQCYIVAPDQYIDAGSIKNGEVKEIDQHALSYSGQQGLLRFLDPYANGNVKSNMTDKEEREFKRRQQNFQMVNYYVMSGGYNNSGVKVIAFSSTPVCSEIHINDKPVTKYEKSLVVSDADVSFREGNKVEYPSGYIKPISLVSTFNGYDTYSGRYYGRGSLEVVYKLDSSIIPEEIRVDYTINSKSGSGSKDIKEFMWNSSITDWEEGVFNYFIINKENIAKYVGPDNILKLKIESNDDSLNMQIPRISLKGSVK